MNISTHKQAGSVYPDDKFIGQVIGEYLGRGSFPLRQETVLPDRSIVLGIVDVCYQTSMRQEEGRSLRFRVGIWDEHAMENFLNSRMNGQLIEFSQGIPFCVPELVKLVPAAPPSNTMILLKTEGKLAMIMGVLHTTSRFWEMLRRENLGWTVSPPDIFTISSFSPGNLNFSRRGDVFVRLSKGRLGQSHTLSPHETGLLGDKLQSGARKIARDAGSMCSDQRIDFEKEAQAVYLAFIGRLLATIQDAHHGATILIVPEPVETPILKFKYKSSFLELRNVLVGLLVDANNLKVVRERMLAKDADIKSLESSRDHLIGSVRQAHDRLRDLTNLYAGFANVDGALVVDGSLQLVGYGAEIAPASSEELLVRECQDHEAREYSERSISVFGTRHRSTFRFVRETKDAVAFTVSQDGAIKGIMQDVEGQVLYWDHIEDYFLLC